jgi:hypothetical protein
MDKIKFVSKNKMVINNLGKEFYINSFSKPNLEEALWNKLITPDILLDEIESMSENAQLMDFPVLNAISISHGCVNIVFKCEKNGGVGGWYDIRIFVQAIRSIRNNGWDDDNLIGKEFKLVQFYTGIAKEEI